MSVARSFALAGFLVMFGVSMASGQEGPRVVLLGSPQLWQKLEFRVENVPAASNVFDPEVIAVDAAFTLPSGDTRRVPAFWYQAYQRRLSGNNEVLTSLGSPEWRVRFAAPAPGEYSITVTVRTNGQAGASSAAEHFSVPAGGVPSGVGYVRLGRNGQGFETGDGEELPLIGANVCWHHSRGTYDYDTWFDAMAGARENFARLWMWPHAFGLEVDSNSLTRYRLDRAWQLDYVFEKASQRGIYLMLALDFHGMYETTPDAWGGNNYWPSNPYNATNGGPCLNPNGFFTNTTAQAVYQKRLRYLVARYGYSPKLLAWEFFNEIDNVYRHLNAADVARWHGIMGRWFKANDPFGHLVTTSLTGSSERAEIWNLPEMDFSQFHSYSGNKPARYIAETSQGLLQRYKKPVLIGEFGLDWRGWKRENDPFLRGFRQGLWGGTLGGSAGTSMSWWWESLHSDNVYPLYTALGAIVKPRGWGRGVWTNISFITSGPPPSFVGDLLPGAAPFNAQLPLSPAWGERPSGQFAVANATTAGESASVLNGFIHGAGHPELKVPFRLSAWLTNNARLVMHVNSVSASPVLMVRADGSELLRTNLPDKDGLTVVNNEYNLDVAVNLPPGRRLIEIINTGSDWAFLDWVRLEQVLPSAWANGWQPSPESIGIRGPRESLIYVIAPGMAYPSGGMLTNPPVQQGTTVRLTNWPSGVFHVEWFDPSTAVRIGTGSAQATNSQLTLTVPPFAEDLVGVIFPPPRLSSAKLTPDRVFHAEIHSETGGQYRLERSENLQNWQQLLHFTNTTGASQFTDPEAKLRPQAVYRLNRSL